MEKNNVSIVYDENTEMIRIINNDGNIVFEGNYWDFTREPAVFQNLFQKLGHTVELDNKPYSEWIY